jgi:hypothetical protein
MIEPVSTPAAAAASATPAAASKPDAVSKGFEQLLVQQLAQAMLKTVGGDMGSAYASLLPTALADSVIGPTHPGGLGLDLGLGQVGS